MYVAERLANIGKQNDKVLLCHYNSIELVVAYFATVVAGKMLLLADPKYKNELSNIIQEYQVEIFIIDHELENQDIHGKSNSQCSLLEACKNYVQTCAISKNDRFLGVTPFFILIA
jgi:acyl-CoA synthetase (AMP-forming)/AMP-acid ligase II